MELDLDEMDANLKQITPSETDRLQQRTKDAKSAEDDIAIAQAINEIEEELKENRPSLFNPSDMMDLDLNEIDANLKQITPSETDRLQQRTKDAKSAEDDIAIAQAINEIEEELKGRRPSLFNPSDMMDLDLNEIDANLKQISPTEDQFIIQSARDAASAEDDLAIAEAIKDVEKELKKTEKSVFNPTTVVMLLIAGGIVTSKIANMFFQ